MTVVGGTCSCYRTGISATSGRDQLCAETRTGRSTRRRGALPTQTPRLVRRALGRRHTPCRARSPQPLHKRDRSTAITRSREPLQTVARRRARGLVHALGGESPPAALSRPAPPRCAVSRRRWRESASGRRPGHRPPARRPLGVITTVGPSNAGTTVPIDADHADLASGLSVTRSPTRAARRPAGALPTQGR